MEFRKMVTMTLYARHWPLERERSQMMARLWRNWNLYVVLKEIYSGATTMEVSQKLKIKL